jgi:hypothetical protein
MTAATLTVGQRTVLDALRGHCFNGPTCCPSQELVARETGYSREFVNRAIKHLERIGELTIAKAQRIGAKWSFNVYTLALWTKPLRRRTLAILDALKRRDHTERTASSGRRSTHRAASSSTPVVPARWSRARGAVRRRPPNEAAWELAWTLARGTGVLR